MAATLTAPGRPPVGHLLRGWRHRRRLSQLEVASEAAVSARHLSFVETGRSKPSRELVLHLAEHLEVPLRERNALLLAAGYAPTYRETPLESEDMTPVRDAVALLLAGHEPFPAIAVDRHWDLVGANAPAGAIMSDGVDPALLAPTCNAIRVVLHPDGLASRVVNFAQYAANLVDRLRREAGAYADDRLGELIEEICGYPGVAGSPSPGATAAELFVPLVLRTGEGELTFFSTLTTFGTARDITVEELAIESFFPADAATAAVLRDQWQAAAG
ncbi:MAG TPA: helix-turn-helix transcriptional regulator [Acidimicrobiales bacterium]|nr:helix-turn-helix transcriptional regulator [Acidimicrobiales bacterium]